MRLAKDTGKRFKALRRTVMRLWGYSSKQQGCRNRKRRNGLSLLIRKKKPL